jgi:hypothetical protein
MKKEGVRWRRKGEEPLLKVIPDPSLDILTVYDTTFVKQIINASIFHLSSVAQVTINHPCMYE